MNRHLPAISLSIIDTTGEVHLMLFSCYLQQTQYSRPPAVFTDC